jgi:hypothetical protein
MGEDPTLDDASDSYGDEGVGAWSASDGGDATGSWSSSEAFCGAMCTYMWGHDPDDIEHGAFCMQTPGHLNRHVCDKNRTHEW